MFPPVLSHILLPLQYWSVPLLRPSGLCLECPDLVKSLEAGLHWIPPPYTRLPFLSNCHCSPILDWLFDVNVIINATISLFDMLTVRFSHSANKQDISINKQILPQTNFSNFFVKLYFPQKFSWPRLEPSTEAENWATWHGSIHQWGAFERSGLTFEHFCLEVV